MDLLGYFRQETRKQHIERTRTELKEGIRRPCCWPGCPHRGNKWIAGQPEAIGRKKERAKESMK
jgi:hypothetical protein